VIGQFLDWCQRAGFGNLEDIEPIHVALTPSIIRVLRQRSRSTSPPSACCSPGLRKKDILAMNPACEVKAPKFSRTEGKTPAVQRSLLTAIIYA
jgi:hypothetical protein